MSHTVTIKGRTEDDVEYEFGGTHDNRCEMYQECGKDWHRHPDPEYYPEDEWSTKRAGHHHLIQGMWMTAIDPKERCALWYVFEGNGPQYVFEGLEVGETRDVTTEWEDEGWELVILPKTNG